MIINFGLKNTRLKIFMNSAVSVLLTNNFQMQLHTQNPSGYSPLLIVITDLHSAAHIQFGVYIKTGRHKAEEL